MKKNYTHAVVISIGCNVKSQQCEHFYIWVTQWLNKYVIKVFIVDDE